MTFVFIHIGLFIAIPFVEVTMEGPETSVSANAARAASIESMENAIMKVRGAPK